MTSRLWTLEPFHRSILMTDPVPTLSCARCGVLIEDEPRRDNTGRPFHAQCFGPETRVRVTGIDIPFRDLVVFFIKLALAGIPAVLVIGLIWFFIAAACWPGIQPLAP